MKSSYRKFLSKILTSFCGESDLLTAKLKRDEMHDELCRKCGGTLTNWSLCSECRQPIKRVCILCGSYTDEVIHNLCFYHLEAFQTGISVDSDAREMKDLLSHYIKDREPEELFA
jgi:predicted amidophosphoribosyltransferase